ncbi:unnamed protein product [Schistosoma margrebowiei]|uniref:Uncharacterized protein n=1 Tax=Schistosoma margrebowiei TaxID=48269 RepID=A0AA84ZS71_9TREM|nr:unnamed protein product [Schistosoma margrebowiei]
MWIILILLTINIIPQNIDFLYGNNHDIKQSKWNNKQQQQQILNIHNLSNYVILNDQNIDLFNFIQRIKRSKSNDVKDLHSMENNKDLNNSNKNDKNDHSEDNDHKNNDPIPNVIDNNKHLINSNNNMPSSSNYHSLSSNQLLHNSMDHDKVLRPEKCIPIEIPLCKNIGYNLTYLPNAFNHETQEEAGLEVHQFYPLVEINCSDDLRLFLCSMYTPICLPNWHYRLTACKSLCESARDGCMPVMRTYGFGWPERMNCDLLPEGNECVSRSNTPNNRKVTSSSSSSSLPSGEQVGMIHKDITTTTTTTINSNNNNNNKINDIILGNGEQLSSTNELYNFIKQIHLYINSILSNNKQHLNHSNIPSSEILNQLHEYLITKVDFQKINKKSFHEINKKKSIKSNENLLNLYLCLPCECRNPFIKSIKSSINEIIIIDHNNKNCIPSCYYPTFNNPSDKTFIIYWLSLWSILCILSTLITIITFMIDLKRFQYPERSIIYISICYFMISIGYIIRIFIGHEFIACNGLMLRINTTGPIQCSIVFLLTYIFSMASFIWWIILTLTWFLAAGLKWSTEAIAKYSQIYHFFAWFIPGTKSIIILILSAIDGDPISGLCTVGSINLYYLRIFILIPMCIYLSLGTIFLFAGFIALFKIRNEIKCQIHSHLKTDKLEKLMIRIGIFSVLYIVPVTIVIACYCYELYYRDLWNKGYNCPCITLPYMKDLTHQNLLDQLRSLIMNHDHDHHHTLSFNDQMIESKHGFTLHFNPPSYLNVQPEYAVFMLKYFMSLVIGITSGFWIWSSKTVNSWQLCLKRVFHRSYRTNSKHHHHHHQRAVSIGVLSHTGVLVPNRSPPPPLPPPSLPNSGTISWNTGQSKVWMNSNNNSKLSNGLNLGVNNCTTWQDDYISNNRLLPQPSSTNLECHHSTGIHISHTMPIPVGSVIGTSGNSLSGLQVNSGSFTNGPLEGTAINGGSGTSLPGQQHNGRKIDANNLFLMSSVPITHI